MAFMQEYRAGRVGVGELAQEIARWQARIEQSPGGPGLGDWLGMSWPEYLEWTVYGRLPDADMSTRCVRRLHGGRSARPRLP